MGLCACLQCSYLALIDQYILLLTLLLISHFSNLQVPSRLSQGVSWCFSSSVGTLVKCYSDDLFYGLRFKVF